MNCPICGSSHQKRARVIAKVFTLKKCCDCSFVFYDADVTAAENANMSYSESDIENYDIQQTSLDDIWFEKIAKKLIKKSGLKTGKVLDVGCGNGLLLKCFKDLGWEASGVDPSGWAKPYAERYGFTLHSCRIQDLKGLDSNFDVIVSTSTLEHLSFPVDFVNSVMEKLKSGGILYIAGVPNYRSLTRRLGLSWFRHNRPLHHVSFFSPQSARALFKTCPLKKIQVGTYGISGLYTAFSIVINAFKRKKAIVPEKSPAKEVEISEVREKTSQDRAKMKKVKGLKRLFLRIITFVFEKLRFPGCGDKLEVYIEK